ncbi:MAG: S8 family serine peptidase [bacterium]|nr:S8 family serine peptidase [bacterium]
MKKKVILMLLAVSMLGITPYVSAEEADVDVMTEMEETDGFEDVSLETFSEDEEPQEILPVEFSEPDPNKSDRFIIKYKRDSASLISNQLEISSYSVQSVADITDAEAASVIGADDVINEETSEMQSIQLEEKVDIEEFVNNVMAEDSDNIEYIQPDYMIDLSALTENDNNNIAENKEASEEDEQTPYLKTDLIEKTVDPSPASISIDIKENTTAEEETGTIVALIDTGIDINHAALTGHIYTNEYDNSADEDGNGYLGDINGWDFYNNTPNVYNSDFGLEQAHGTHIAGIIADTAPDAKILPLKVFEHGTAYTSDIIEAIHYAESMGAKIANCSWGCTDENAALKEAMEQSQMTFVCAVGNNRLNLNETPIYPACYELDNIVSVTSVNVDGGLSYFSNYGNVDIAALGRDVEGIFPENETGTLSGTSISAGYVTGALASAYTTGEETVNRMFSSADKLMNLQETVTDGRRLNLENLLNNVSVTEVTDTNPEEDFNTEGYTRTPEASWELFSSLDNVSITAGKEYIAVLKADGSVWTWGKNNYGQLGLGNYTNTTNPQQVPNLTGISQISAGTYHMMAVNTSGQAYAWGYNVEGCLGNGTKTNSTVPVKMLNASNTSAVYGGEKVSFVINKNGELFVCGQNYSGEQCDNTQNVQTVLHKVSISERVKMADGEYGSCMAVTEDGKLYTWGSNYYGKLGNGQEENNCVPQLVIDSGIVEADMGTFNAMARSEDGKVYFWGYSSNNYPTLLNDISGATKIIAGRQQEYIMLDTTVKGRGPNANGSLGVGDTSWHSSWTSVTGDFKDIAIREYWGAAIGTNGCIYTWGIRNADTGEYVTAPEKLSDKINDFAADEIENATVASLGETKGNLISEEDVDYYKFTPTTTGIYSIYSISEIDLVCKVYTKEMDGSFAQKFSNDDGYGIMGGCSRDFYLSKPLTAGTEYYIYVYPYGSNYSGEYTMYIRREGSSTAVSISGDAGVEKNIFMNVRNISSFSNRTITITYDSSKLELVDGCLFNPNANLTAGVVSGTNVTIVSAKPGEIVFKMSYSIPSGRKLTGTVNILKFKSLVSGYKTISYKLNDLS